MYYLLESIGEDDRGDDTENFIGVFDDRSIPEAYVAKVTKKALQDNYESYLFWQFHGELKTQHLDQIQPLELARAEAWQTQRPRYVGDQKDKLALEAHRKNKNRWQEEANAATKVVQDYLAEHVIKPARAMAIDRKFEEIPAELIADMRGWGYMPRFKITEIEINPKLENDVE